MAFGTADRSFTRLASTKRWSLVTLGPKALRSGSWLSGLGLICVLMVCWGCSATGRHVAKAGAEPAEKVATEKSGSSAKQEKASSEAVHKGEQEPSLPSREKRRIRTGRTELDIVREIAIDLSKKHAPVERMKVCFAKKSGEWWITLFKESGHAFDIKQYIWNSRDDKLDPYCVEKVIPRDAVEDYLFEKRVDRDCTAFEHTKNGGWAAVKGRHSGKRPETSSHVPDRPDRRSRDSDSSRGEGLRLVNSVDTGDGVNVTNVSTGPARVPDYVFVYGSEMKHTDLLKWLKSKGYKPELLLAASAAKLEGYDFVWNYYSEVKGGGAANIQPSKDAAVWGLLLELDSSLLTALDRKQGSPVTYSRGPKRIPVRRIADGRTMLAWVYTAKPNRNGRTDVWPTREYKRGIVEAASFWGFPAPYLERIRQWHTSR
jgi:hypothetical protein